MDNGNYDIPASWQTVLTMMNNVGNILGIMIDGWSIEIGMVIKKVMHIAFFAVAFTFILVFAPSKEVIGQLLMGFPNGIFGVLGPIYASGAMYGVLRG